MRYRIFLVYASVVWILYSLGWSCGGPSAPPSEIPTSVDAVETTGVAPAEEPAPAGESKGPPWIHNDYAQALAEARKSNKPMLVDFWAKWCPTCLYMNSYVLGNPGLRDVYDRFIWVSIDTDLVSNERAVEHYKPAFRPIYLVVSPIGESVEGLKSGSMSVTKFRDFLIDAEKHHLASLVSSSNLTSDDPLYMVREGDRAMAVKDWKAAAAAYTKAVDHSPADWPRRPITLENQINALYLAGDWAVCADVTHAEMDTIPAGPHLILALYFGYQCAKASGVQQEKKEALQKAILPKIQAILSDPRAPLSIMDRTDAMDLAAAIYRDLKDDTNAREMTLKQRQLLDETMAGAPGPWAKLAFLGSQIQVYLELDLGAELIPSLEALVQEMPREIEPIEHLAKLHFELKNYDLALKANRQSLALAPDTRKPFIYARIAKIAKVRGNRPAEVEALNKVISTMKALPQAFQFQVIIERAREALENPDKE